MKKVFILISILLIFSVVLTAQQTNQDYTQYIQKFHEIAIRQQKKYGIPASIILAQGLLESGAGKGRLAVQANNHFGIKCHNWTGETIFQDDDVRNECFRKYNHVLDSYDDHSQFLSSKPRYSNLFKLNSTDYVGWAHGLKAAGYATDPGYASKLISLIERYNLHQYDSAKPSHEKMDEISKSDTYFVREIYKSNYLKITVAAQGDTFRSLSTELGIAENKLRLYNDVDETTELKPGNIVYLAKKKKRAACPNKIHVVQSGETMYSISQVYGIQIISLYKLNKLSFDKGATVGQILKLR